MKKGFLILVVLVILLMAGAAPVFAFDPPGQGADNATDTILWYGDNLTIESDNLTLTIVDLEDALVAAAEAQAEVLTANQTSVANQYLALLLVTLIVALAFWKNNLFLYALAMPVSMVYGLSLATDAVSGSSLWVTGIIIAIIGTYCLFKVVMIGLEDVKARRK